MLNAVLVCVVKQWSQGLKLLLENAEIAFSKQSLTQKFNFVQKLFCIVKYLKQAQIQQGVETILSLPKVRTYILWQKDQPQLMTIA